MEREGALLMPLRSTKEQKDLYKKKGECEERAVPEWCLYLYTSDVY
jgi:hypothetical protein